MKYKLNVEISFNDKYTNEEYEVGKVITVSEARGKELLGDPRKLVSLKESVEDSSAKKKAEEEAAKLKAEAEAKAKEEAEKKAAEEAAKKKAEEENKNK